MNYIPYGNKKTVPSRMARKRLKQTAFMKNYKLSKIARKKRRLERLDLLGE